MKRSFTIVCLVVALGLLVWALNQHDSRPPGEGRLIFTRQEMPGLHVLSVVFTRETEREKTRANALIQNMFNEETGEGDTEGDLGPILWAIVGETPIRPIVIQSEQELLAMIREARFDALPMDAPSTQSGPADSLKSTYLIRPSAH